METCPNCGQPIRATARFCTSCGYRIPERVQGTTSTSSASGFASTWIEESTGAAPEVAAAAQPASTWPASPTSTDAQTERAPAVPVVAKAEEPVAESVYAPPVVAPDPIDEIVAATAGFNEQEETIAEKSQNKVNIALYHIETLRQILPDLSNWSEERAQSVNEAIATMENAIKGREGDDDAFNGLRQTVAAAKKDPRDIDVMIALSDRAVDIEDLLKAHDAYSIGIRTALIDLKPLAVEYVRVPKRRSAPTRRASTTRSRSSASKSASTAKSSATGRTTKSSSSASTRKTAASKTSGE